MEKLISPESRKATCSPAAATTATTAANTLSQQRSGAKIEHLLHGLFSGFSEYVGLQVLVLRKGERWRGAIAWREMT